MEEVTVKIRPPYILFNCPSTLGVRAERISPSCKWDKRFGAFKAPFGIEQLVLLKREYPSAVIVEGQEHIDFLKMIAKNVEQGKISYVSIDQDPNGPKFSRPHEFKLKPFNHQMNGLHCLDLFLGAPLFADCGCLVGSTVIKVNRGGCLRKYSLKQMFERFHSSWDKSITTFVRSFKGDHIGLHPVKDVVESGVKKVFELTLVDGHSIVATWDHEIMTRDGWVQLGELTLSHEVMIDSLYRYQKKEIKEKKVKKGDQRIAVGQYHSFARKQLSHQGRSHSFLIEIHRAIYEANLNGMPLKEFVETTYLLKGKELKYIDPKEFHIHHKDEDHFNNAIDNLEVLPVSDHLKGHGVKTYNHFGHGEPCYSRVSSIQFIGEEMTYDIVCEDPHRNFVANGIVVHNSGKTATTLWDIEIKLKEGKLKKSKTLIVAKLMTLHSGWYEDTEKFTNLNSLVLWQPPKSKTNYNKEEVTIVTDHGPKPPGKGKSYEKVEVFFKTGEIAILKSAKKFDPRKHVRMARKWKQVGDIKYGQETLTPIKITNIRSENIKELISSHEHDIHIINHEGLVLFQDELAQRGYDYIAVDESTVIKNPKSKTFEALMHIASGSTYRRVLTGTPSPQGPQDLWSQMFFLDYGYSLGPDYKEFLAKYFNVIKFGSHEAGTYRGEKPVIRKDGAGGKVGTLEYVQSRLTNRIYRCRLRDCIDLPPMTERVLDVYLDGELRKHYTQMEEELKVELQDKEVEVTTDLAKILKLRQITSGFIISKDKSVIRLSNVNPKLEVLKSFLEEIGDEEKVVIFAVYREEIKMLLDHFGDKAVAIYGGGTAEKRLNAREEFVFNEGIKYIICQPQSAAYGVNGLTVARYLIFYSSENRSDLRYQAIKRIERTGQQRAQYVIHLIAYDTIDEVIQKSNDRKDDIQQKTIDFEIINRFKGG